MDELFGESRFSSEIIWKRTSAHSDADGYANVHDAFLFYAKSATVPFYPQYQPYTDDYVAERYKHIETAGQERGRDMQTITSSAQV
jgi:adenine specific DNA methylase Mod